MITRIKGLLKVEIMFLMPMKNSGVTAVKK